MATNLFRNKEYNITLLSDAFYLAHDNIRKLKEASYQLQEEARGNDCVLYCFLMAMSRWAAKYNRSDPNIPPELKDFFDRGLNQFSKDWLMPVRQADGSTQYMPFHIATRDDFEKVVDSFLLQQIKT